MYTVRGCSDSGGKCTLPKDPRTRGALGVVNVECACGGVADVGVPAAAIPETLIASLWTRNAPRH